ncbi:MAG: GNAT family N-acetyltransferase, partial [Planctomycetaceae bacterium]
YLRNCREHPQGINLPAGWIPYSRYWLVRNGTTIVATSSLRHKLNESLMHEGGHIGYGTRPSCRRRGYGAEICRQTLAQARKMGISPILVTCDADNTGSRRILESNGGRLENQVISSATGKLKNRYWFD